MEPQDDVSLVHRVFLLAYRPERQRLAGGQHMGLALNAAALQGLLDAGFLADEGGRVRVAASRGAVPDGALEADVFARVVASDRSRSWRHWVKKSAAFAVGTVRTELARSRVLRVEKTRVLLVFPYHSVALRQPRMRTAALAGVRDALRATQPASRVPRCQAATTVLVHIAEMNTVMSGRERRAARGRVDELAAGLGPVPEALRKAVRDAKATSSGGGG
ncbi:GOLPH3/VPS74 family protein [Streptodolium elevatio]|uniref:GPP34 family phosphoprotein n=1 Tax=Streptodolium elevatio TaxID=3157996 RepID=A0ABV3DQG0_9ACTN